MADKGRAGWGRVMPKMLRWVGLVVLFFVSFFFFVYLMFPMDALKHRFVGEIEKALGPSFEVSVEDLDTHWLSGVTLQSFELLKRSEGQALPAWKAKELTAGVGIFSLLFGSPKIYFSVDMENGELNGKVQKKNKDWYFHCELSDVDLKEFPILKAELGLNAASDISGNIDFVYDPAEPLRASGEIRLQFDRLELLASEVKLGEMGIFSLPALLFSKGNSKLEAKIERGAVSVDRFNFADGDLGLDITGKIYLGQTLDRYRLNLRGNFEMSQKLGEAISLVTAFIEKQKGEDGKYPLSVTGPMNRPHIKIGAMSLPL